MPLTRDQAQQLASLTAACRPHGARRWDEPGILAALAKVKHLSLADVILAAVRAADDRSLETPAQIGNPAAPCWRERNPGRPEPSVRATGPWCGICGVKADVHRADDHDFEPPVDRRRAPDAIRQIVESVKAEKVPTKPPTEPTEHTPDPRATEARAALTEEEADD